MSFEDSYLGKIRQLVGSQLLLVPGARIVIEEPDGKILLQKRSDLGVWGLPGGNAEPGEDLTSVVEREVLEETGLIITGATPFGFGCNPEIETVEFPNGDRCQFFVLNFFTRSFSGDLRILDGESLALEWFRMDKLPRMLPNMEASVRAYGSYRSNGEFQMI
ncbi:NUDIX domain-containing protein [Leisingera sp. M527]|uniref:NUDIX domain-containing protein n=1 Tax=Leisingera sp. M527 TaxID=2867014 RepID=UPI0021A80D56|nr:NUDIX domain-containing protein [Leisingera sp. M527]UWQ32179.1 NUDIX domain-containing protein [Leisingera sp. M527]